MPELPEVETVRRGLEPVLVGHRFVRVEQRRKDLRFPLPPRFAERLTGRRIERLDRRAKYILVHLDRGEVLAMHLGMTGRFIVSRPGLAEGRTLGEYEYQHGKDARHDHLVFTVSGGTVVTYNDARRFGYMTLIPEREIENDAFFAGLGVEPLGPGLTAAYLARRAVGRKVDLKAFLMDQRNVAGLGNIYVCEALFRAGLDPWKPASRLATSSGKPRPAAERLAAQIKAVLADAIRAGGSTLRDYKHADGNIGLFQNEFSVYGRQGGPCARPGCRAPCAASRRAAGRRSTARCASAEQNRRVGQRLALPSAFGAFSPDRRTWCGRGLTDQVNHNLNQ